MQEIIDQLIQRAGLSHEQATKALATIKDFVKEKFPMMAGAVDNLLGADVGASTTTTAAASNAAASGSGDFLDKISDYIPGATGEKVEGFAKNAEHNVEDFLGGLKDKFTGGNK